MHLISVTSVVQNTNLTRVLVLVLALVSWAIPLTAQESAVQFNLVCEGSRKTGPVIQNGVETSAGREDSYSIEFSIDLVSMTFTSRRGSSVTAKKEIEKAKPSEIILKREYIDRINGGTRFTSEEHQMLSLGRGDVYYAHWLRKTRVMDDGLGIRIATIGADFDIEAKCSKSPYQAF